MSEYRREQSPVANTTTVFGIPVGRTKKPKAPKPVNYQESRVKQPSKYSGQRISKSQVPKPKARPKKK